MQCVCAAHSEVTAGCVVLTMQLNKEGHSDRTGFAGEPQLKEHGREGAPHRAQVGVTDRAAPLHRVVVAARPRGVRPVRAAAA